MIRRMTRTPNKTTREIREKDITGLKYFDKLAPMLERLHQVGCREGS
jgi:hypothetical protein